MASRSIVRSNMNINLSSLVLILNLAAALQGYQVKHLKCNSAKHPS